MVSEERRKSPRIKDEGLSLRLEGFDSVTHTLNISPSGVYCKVDKELPLMSRLKLALVLPDSSREDGVKSMEVTGIVVRQHPVVIDGATKHYDVAIFFEDLSPKDKDAISAYIDRNKRG